MTLNELLPVIADDTIIHIKDSKGKVVFNDIKMNYKPNTIENRARTNWLDNEWVDYIVPDDLDVLIIYMY